jgi:hypothetical protein
VQALPASQSTNTTSFLPRVQRTSTPPNYNRIPSLFSRYSQLIFSRRVLLIPPRITSVLYRRFPLFHPAICVVESVCRVWTPPPSIDLTSSLLLALPSIHTHRHRYSFLQPVGFMCFVVARLAALQWLLHLTNRAPRHAPPLSTSFSLAGVRAGVHAPVEAHDVPVPPSLRCSLRRITARDVAAFILFVPLIASVISRWAGDRPSFDLTVPLLVCFLLTTLFSSSRLGLLRESQVCMNLAGCCCCCCCCLLCSTPPTTRFAHTTFPQRLIRQSRYSSIPQRVTCRTTS